MSENTGPPTGGDESIVDEYPQDSGFEDAKLDTEVAAAAAAAADVDLTGVSDADLLEASGDIPANEAQDAPGDDPALDLGPEVLSSEAVLDNIDITSIGFGSPDGVHPRDFDPTDPSHFEQIRSPIDGID